MRKHERFIVVGKAGSAVVTLSEYGVCRVELRKYRRGSHKKPDSAQGRKAAAQIQDMLDGCPVQEELMLDISEGTAFQRGVWEILRSIPFGQTRSYLWVARRLGNPRAAHAVGPACGANPLPLVIPCHRVIMADGSLGGFTGGIELKRRLLLLEHEHICKHDQ